MPVTPSYIYLVDRDFGPLVLKFCTYFPYPAKPCLNGHEWLKRQLTQRGPDGTRSAPPAHWVVPRGPGR